ncbi:MAG: host attachment protein [bacterium]|nr:host attachment protein [bacterium]
MKLSGTLAEKGIHAFDAEPHTSQGHDIPRIWLIVADREHAILFRKTGLGLERIADAKTGHSKGKHDDGKGTGFHGYDPKTAHKHHGDGDFVQKMAAWLDTAEREHVFDRLVLVAAPRTLGDFREALSKNVFARVAAEVDKDLMKLPETQIKDHLKDIIWF